MLDCQRVSTRFCFPGISVTTPYTQLPTPSFLAKYFIPRISTSRMSETYLQVIELLRAGSDAIAKAASRLEARDIGPAIDLQAKSRVGLIRLHDIVRSGL
jgi:hypothetical protein